MPNQISPRLSGWPERLATLALDCDRSFACDQARLLREMRDLLLVAKHGVLTGADQFRSAMQAQAYESAALILLGEDCGFMLSRGAGGRYLASVVLPGRQDEYSASGDTAALALVGALALAMRQAPPLRPEMGEMAPPPLMRLN